jgi:hypothetical protein
MIEAASTSRHASQSLHATRSRGDPLCEPVAERRPEQVGSGDDKAGHQLDEQEQEEQGHPDACNGIMSHELLRLSRQERSRIGAQ